MPSSSPLHKISLVPEVTYGTTPANPTMLLKLITGCTLALAKGKIESEAIDPTRQVLEVRPGNRQVGGEIAFELGYGGFDNILEAALCGTWAPRVAAYAAATISAASADNSLNDSGAAFPVFTVGEKILIAGFTGTVGNNGIATVVSRTASKIVISGITLVNDAAGETVTLTSETGVLVPGTTRHSFSVLRQFTDLDAGQLPFHLFKGVEFNTLALTIAPEAYVKATVACVGREMALSGTAPSGTTYTAASSNKPIDSFTGTITVDGVAVASVTEIQFTLENGLEPRFCVFDDKTSRPKIGKTRVTGTLTVYFEDSAMIAAFNGGVKKNLSFTLVDPDGNEFQFDLPSILPTGGQVDVQGENDITLPIPFQAIYESGEDEPDALKITRTPV